MGEIYHDGAHRLCVDIGRGVLAHSNGRFGPKDTPYSPSPALNMAGSTMISFVSNRRKPKPLRERISDPLTPAEIERMEARATDEASRSAISKRGQPREHVNTSRPTLPNANIQDDVCQYSLPTTASRPDGRGFLERNDGPVRSHTVSTEQQKKLKREPSSSTLRSFYDRKKSPLAVSQQTSDSSARDLALRKGHPPVIPMPLGDVSRPQPPKSASTITEAVLKRRPGRLDFSTLFPKPLPQSGPLLSPERYTHSPPPLSPTSEMDSLEQQPPPLLRDIFVGGTRQHFTPSFTHISHQPNTSADSKMHVQRPSGSTKNWFDGQAGNISEDDSECDPEMRPCFIDKAFRTASSHRLLRSDSRPRHRIAQEVRTHRSSGHPPSKNTEKSPSVGIKAPDESVLREVLHNWEVKPRNATAEKRTPVSRSHSSPSNALDLADLQEQSVLCLSSSDDEDYHIEKEELPRPRQQEPHLRDSIGVDSIDSDIEIGTAQAVDTSFLGTFKPRAQSNSLRHCSSTNAKLKVERPRAVKIPDRHSSKQAVAPNLDNMVLLTSDDGILDTPVPDMGDRESLSSKHSTRTAPAMTRRESPLLIALTPQEASLLGAMRSMRASMRRNIRPDEGSFPKSLAGPCHSIANSSRSRSVDNKPVRLDPDSMDGSKDCYTNAVSIEPSLPSVPVSLVFSEAGPSPTTGRDSPTTPTLDAPGGMDVHGFGDCGSGELYEAKKNHFGHSRCQTGGNQVMALDHFQAPPRKEIFPSKEYPWVFGGLTESANTAIIYQAGNRCQSVPRTWTAVRVWEERNGNEGG